MDSSSITTPDWSTTTTSATDQHQKQQHLHEDHHNYSLNIPSASNQLTPTINHHFPIDEQLGSFHSSLTNLESLSLDDTINHNTFISSSNHFNLNHPISILQAYNLNNHQQLDHPDQHQLPDQNQISGSNFNSSASSSASSVSTSSSSSKSSPLSSSSVHHEDQISQSSSSLFPPNPTSNLHVDPETQSVDPPSGPNQTSSSSSSSSPSNPQTPIDPPEPIQSSSSPSLASKSSSQTTTTQQPQPRLSEMAPPPQPAEKSRAGRKAVAAIRGGGGLGAKGSRANVFERVISRTRPKYLPPKDLVEDQKHLKEFDAMMTASIELQKKKRELEVEKKLAREKLLASYQPTWEKEVLPNWKSVLRDDVSGRGLRKMWWLGTMPPRHRGRLWHQCIGNAGAVGRSAFTKSVALAKSLINSNPSRFPAEILNNIDAEIAMTLPKLKLFQEGGPMYAEFREVLLAWSVFWREQPYYPPGSAHVAAMFLINMPPPDAFLSLVNITRKSCLSYFYNNRQAEVEAFYRVFETLLSERMPKVFRNFEQRMIRPESYLKPWLIYLFSAHLPLQLATRIMDIFVLEGDSFLFRVALAILEILEARLLNPDKPEIEAVFKGEDRGARRIVARNTMSIYGQRTLEQVTADEAYEEMGCNEENVFKILDQSDWNEALWDRLVARELPD